ncbi:MAG: type II toxin-antitoxin system RelE/ParE family toxin [Chlamydiae bacterium]|nr:type II toxin-antitoxin system RelE/ParE family toxin [Chlamydiota bacterium]
MAKYHIYETQEYKEWLATETLKSQRQIHSRVLKIEEEGHFGHHKYLQGAEVWELKFNDGRRVYYAPLPESNIILLLGGNKNGQERDIKKASKIFSKINEIKLS